MVGPFLPTLCPQFHNFNQSTTRNTINDNVSFLVILFQWSFNVAHTACTQPSDRRTRGRDWKGSFVGAWLLRPNIYLSTIRPLTYIQGLTVNQHCVELGHRIHHISACTGLTDTSAFLWGVDLGHNDAPAQAQASVCDIHHLLIIFLVFKLKEPICGS